MKLLVFVLVIFIDVTWGSEFKSLSCSRNGTRIVFVNGVWNSANDSRKSTEFIQFLVQGNEKRFDSSGELEFKNVWNPSESWDLDLIQVAVQVFKAAGLKVEESVSEYKYDKKVWCLDHPDVCKEVDSRAARMLISPKYNSEKTRADLADKITGALFVGKKVLLVSHSQGNLYANEVYERIRNAYPKETEKYFGNLQVAPATRAISAKNGKYILLAQDFVIGVLSSLPFTTQSANYLAVGIPSGTPDFHRFIEYYLNSDFNLIGRKQGDVLPRIRSADRVFLDTLEELSWQLANNDTECCEGRDGRYYRADYETEPQGFVEESVSIAEDADVVLSPETQLCGEISIGSGADVSILDTSLVQGKVSVGKGAKLYVSEESQINGNVSIDSEAELSLSNSSTVEENLTVGSRSRLLVFDSSRVKGDVLINTDVSVSVSGNSQVLGKVDFSKSGPHSHIYLDNFSGLEGLEQISVAGDVYLDNSYLVNNRDDLNLQLINHSENLPLYFERSYVDGPSTFDGPIFSTDVYVEGVNALGGTEFNPSSERAIYGPSIDNAAIFHGTTTNGFFFVGRTLEASVIEGKTKIKPDGSWGSTFVEPHEYGLTNVSVIDHVSLSGQVDPDTYLEGASIGNNANGVIIGPGSRIYGNSSLKGSVVIEGSQFRGTWNGGVNDDGNSGVLSGSTLVNTSGGQSRDPYSVQSVGGAPYITGSVIYDTGISDTPYISGSELNSCGVSCDAYLNGEIANDLSFGCGYHTGQEGVLSEPKAIQFAEHRFEKLRKKSEKKIAAVLQKIKYLNR